MKVKHTGHIHTTREHICNVTASLEREWGIFYKRSGSIPRNTCVACET